MSNVDTDVFITGGTGFIGAAIAKALLQRGLRVTCMDKYPTPERLGEDANRVRIIEGDVMDADFVDSWVARSERVIHLAAVVGVDHYIIRPHKVLDVNIMGTRNVQQSCMNHGRPLLFSSTSETYGRNQGLLREDSERIYGPAHNHRWCYAISKSVNEHYAYAYAKQGLDFVAVRYFNVYGPMLDKPGSGRVVSKFIGNIINKEPMVLVDGGHAVRSLCYIDDAAEATARLALGLGPGASYRNRSINIGRADPISMAELAQIMIDLSGHEAGTKIVSGSEFFGPGFQDVPYRVPVIEALPEAIGFEAQIDAEEGLSRVLAHWGLLSKNPKRGQRRAEIPNVRPYFESGAELNGRIQRILASGHATNGGPIQVELERRLADWLGVEEAAVVSNGADALSLVFAAAGLNSTRRKAILPSYTFIATLNAVTDAGLEPVFCDIDPDTFTMCPKALSALLSSLNDVAWVIPVNVFGVPPQLTRIIARAETAGARVLYDNCQGFGTEIDGIRIPRGPFAQTFSMHATKVLPGVEGGVIVSDDRKVLAEIRQMRNHGIAQNPTLSIPGMNSKLDEVRSAIALEQLEHIDGAIQRRRRYGARLREFVGKTGLDGTFRLQHIPMGVATNFQNHGVLANITEPARRDAVITHFRNLGIGARAYFHPALHHLERFRNQTFDLPNTEKVSAGWICLPIHSRMTESDLSTIERGLVSAAEYLAAEQHVVTRNSQEAT